MSKDENHIAAFKFYKSGYLDGLMNDKLLSNQFYSSIIKSDDFQRLKKVSFLGAIDYVNSGNKSNKSNRYLHSIDVAKLALYVCEKRQYNKDITDHVVTAALLHDIGHAPLSHSMESSFYQEFGLDHHLASTNVITKGEGKYSLTEVLKQEVDINLVVELIEQRSNEYFSDIFNSKINIDTIDGIHKSLAFINMPNSYNKYSLVQAAFINDCDHRVKVLDHFWKAKNCVYKNIITSGIGAIADHISKEYFFDNLNKIDESYFYKKETALINGSKPIFKGFSKRLQEIEYIYHDINEVDHETLLISVIDREYKANKKIDFNSCSNLNDFIDKRYQVSKEKREKKISYTEGNKSVYLSNVQYGLFG